MTALGCIYSNHPFDTEKNICMYAHISTNQPTNQPTSLTTHPTIIPPSYFHFPLLHLPSFLPSFLSFPFFLNQSIHSFVSLSTTYLPHALHHLPISFLSSTTTSLISLHLSYFSRTHLISRTHTLIYISPSHTHLQYLPHTHISTYHCHFFSFPHFPFHFSLFTFTLKPSSISITTLSTLS